MPTTVIAEQIIKASARDAWRTVARGDGVDQWFGSVITSCRIEGSGAGAKRFCTMPDGAKLAERILEVNDAAMRFRYAVDEHPLPARSVVATIDVADLGDGRARVTWGAEFEAAPEASDMIKQMLGGIYQQGIAALEAHCAA